MVTRIQHHRISICAVIFFGITRLSISLGDLLTHASLSSQIDFPKLAKELDMKNPRSAVNAWVSRHKHSAGFTAPLANHMTAVPDQEKDGLDPQALRQHRWW